MIQEQATRSIVMSALSHLQTVSHIALVREDRYWVAYNAFVLSFFLCRKMMAHGHVLRIMEHLMWCVICMESSVPLMACKYLPLRTDFYVAITHCYYFITHQNEAERFARRALDKVNELAKLERASLSDHTPGSELIFKEATMKLGVLVFKTCIFESHKRVKATFKSKTRLSLKELLQLPSPRSSTEKMLGEMFSNPSGQFLAILETLTDLSRRSMDRGPPPTMLDLDHDTLNNVYMVRKMAPGYKFIHMGFRLNLEPYREEI